MNEPAMRRELATTEAVLRPAVDATDDRAAALYLLGFVHGQQAMIRAGEKPPRKNREGWT